MFDLRDSLLGRIDIARGGEPGDEVVSRASPASCEGLARETSDEASTSEMSSDLCLLHRSTQLLGGHARCHEATPAAMCHALFCGQAMAGVLPTPLLYMRVVVPYDH